MLGAYQQLDAAASTLLVEQLVEVRIPIHHADLVHLEKFLLELRAPPG